MTYVPLIDANTGEIDVARIVRRAPERAASEWGGWDFPPSYHTKALEWLTERARSERLQWRSDRGLPDDSPMSEVIMPSWGASGDSYRR